MITIAIFFESLEIYVSNNMFEKIRPSPTVSGKCPRFWRSQFLEVLGSAKVLRCLEGLAELECPREGVGLRFSAAALI